MTMGVVIKSGCGFMCVPFITPLLKILRRGLLNSINLMQTYSHFCVVYIPPNSKGLSTLHSQCALNAH